MILGAAVLGATSIYDDSLIRRQGVGIPNPGRPLNLDFYTLTQVQGVKQAAPGNKRPECYVMNSYGCRM
jgi:hypothetical protein